MKKLLLFAFFYLKTTLFALSLFNFVKNQHLEMKKIKIKEGPTTKVTLKINLFYT
jgi:hypothetical protein